MPASSPASSGVTACQDSFGYATHSGICISSTSWRDKYVRHLDLVSLPLPPQQPPPVSIPSLRFAGCDASATRKALHMGTPSPRRGRESSVFTWPDGEWVHPLIPPLSSLPHCWESSELDSEWQRPALSSQTRNSPPVDRPLPIPTPAPQWRLRSAPPESPRSRPSASAPPPSRPW